ncbi:MAG TPA: GNAT family N-acetyltransferase [Acidimicrobiia bacterium]|nr:GNAT family N-acetyltransferase [Acidimicrobiia bacterium]
MWEIRTITDDDVDLFRSRLSRGFGGDIDSDDSAAERFRSIFEYDRTLAVFEAGDIVGTGAAFSLGVTAPGGVEVPMAGTTVISVQPTHRRRGVLRELMDRHLEDVTDRGEPLAGLWASESSIYGRFGYGPSTFRYSTEIDTPTVKMSDPPAKRSVRLIDSEDAESMIRSVYEAVRPTRPGMLTRSDPWWTHRLMADPESWRGGKSAHRYLVFEEDGSPTGYATYRQKEKWEDFVAGGEIRVTEVIAADPNAHKGIWAFLTNIDLFNKLEWWNLPLDDALPNIITDQRRVRRRLVDALWVRVMDVTAALEARGYEHDGTVTIEVIDPTRFRAAGTYRLEVVDGVAACDRTSASAELRLGADVLGHLYLGGGNAIAMADAGRIEGDPAAVARLHRIFRTDRAPWCPEVF